MVFKINTWSSRQAMVGGMVSLKCADIGDWAQILLPPVGQKWFSGF